MLIYYSRNKNVRVTILQIKYVNNYYCYYDIISSLIHIILISQIAQVKYNLDNYIK